MKDDWVIWLTKECGERFLGLPPTKGNHRFCVTGKFISDGPSGVGVWIEVDCIQKFDIASNNPLEAWTVNMKSCLILWRDISYVQKGEKSKGIGFAAEKSK